MRTECVSSAYRLAGFIPTVGIEITLAQHFLRFQWNFDKSAGVRNIGIFMQSLMTPDNLDTADYLLRSLNSTQEVGEVQGWKSKPQIPLTAIVDSR